MTSRLNQELSLQIFDQPIAIRTDSPYFYNVIDQMYRRFRVPVSDSPNQTIHIPPNGHGPRAENASPQVSAFDVSRLVTTFTATVRTHLLIHAGVLSRNGEGILIVAPSMHGKTTLTLELLRRGLDFLSDEIAALGLTDNLIHPFPRSLVIREGSLALAGFPALPSNTPTWLGKQIVDAETLRPGCLGKPVPIRHVFFLHDGAKQLAQPTPNAPSCGLLLSTLSSTLRKSIEAIGGLESLTVGELDNRPYLTIYAQDRPAVLRTIEALCLAHGIELIHLGYRPLHRPSFAGPAALTNIPQSAAVMQLLQQFLGGYHSALLREELGNSPVRLSMTLARMLRNANCYQLSVGPLDQMADIICNTVN